MSFHGAHLFEGQYLLLYHSLSLTGKPLLAQKALEGAGPWDYYSL